MEFMCTTLSVVSIVFTLGTDRGGWHCGNMCFGTFTLPARVFFFKSLSPLALSSRAV